MNIINKILKTTDTCSLKMLMRVYEKLKKLLQDVDIY